MNYTLKRVVEKLKRREGVWDFMKCVYYEIKLVYLNPLIKKSWTPDNEGLLIDKILQNKRKGFYVDIGAYDPDLGSNTQHFYAKGWSGINVEPDKVRYALLKKVRIRDKCLNIGMSNKQGKLTFYRMFPESLSTFSRNIMEMNKKQGFRLVSKEIVPVTTLAKVFNTYIKKRVIDFLSIDTEGYDLAVLQGNDWRKYRPTVICVEKGSRRMQEDIGRLLNMHGYILSDSTYNNNIYRLK